MRLYSLFFCEVIFQVLRFGFQLGLAKSIIITAWPFAVSGLLGSVMISTDIFIIGLLRSAQEVGYYSAVDKIIQFLYAPSLILATSSFPIFAKLAGTDDAKISQVFRRLLQIILFFLIPITLGGVIIAPRLVRLAFGNGYTGAIFPLQILLFTLSFRFVSILLTNIVFAYNKQRTLIFYTVLSITLNIIFDLAFIPKFGLAGSAFATLLAHIIGGLYLWSK